MLETVIFCTKPSGSRESPSKESSLGLASRKSVATTGVEHMVLLLNPFLFAVIERVPGLDGLTARRYAPSWPLPWLASPFASTSSPFKGLSLHSPIVTVASSTGSPNWSRTVTRTRCSLPAVSEEGEVVMEKRLSPVMRKVFVMVAVESPDCSVISIWLVEARFAFKRMKPLVFLPAGELSVVIVVFSFWLSAKESSSCGLVEAVVRTSTAFTSSWLVVFIVILSRVESSARMSNAIENSLLASTSLELFWKEKRVQNPESQVNASLATCRVCLFALLVQKSASVDVEDKALSLSWSSGVMKGSLPWKPCRLYNSVIFSPGCALLFTLSLKLSLEERIDSMNLEN